jgi:DNA-binding XRE family transcriptional regulator
MYFLMSQVDEDKKVLLVLGRVLKESRDEEGISQERLAQLVGVHRNYIGRMERGEQNASITIWLRVCQILDIDLSKIFSDL